jgi:hypothetical protein
VLFEGPDSRMAPAETRGEWSKARGLGQQASAAIISSSCPRLSQGKAMPCWSETNSLNILYYPQVIL